MTIYKSIRQYFSLIREGKSFHDKKVIAIYFLSAPMRLLSRIIGKKVNHLLMSNIKIKNDDGVFFCGNSIFSAWTASSFYEIKLRKYFDLSEGAFVDVGANIGKYSILLGNKLSPHGQVLAIEPEPKNFKILTKNIYLNGLKNVTAINAGCFSKKDSLKFYLDNIGIGGHSLIKSANKSISIEVDTLDNIIKNNNIKNVGLIKIDVEGVESDVLIGAKNTLKKYHPKILVEAWTDEYFKKIKSVLDQFNYKYKKIGSQDYLAY